ncbi:MAG TPA: DUF3793 domain-containing protein [Erysipelotrichaceae bacterium]|nr:DUF3793 domain-containing protein [Erysipelotrichaceae bacterium]
MSDAELIEYCSPTLAGLKTGSLFSTKAADWPALRKQLFEANRRLVKKGIRVIPLQFRNGRCLIYVFRPADLLEDLKQESVRSTLSQMGYQTSGTAECLRHLMERLRAQKEFPHEIGFFLGYPAEDVLGFMHDPDTGCVHHGLWKVYGDAEKAEAKFRQYDACLRIYRKRLALGIDLRDLAVKKH